MERTMPAVAVLSSSSANQLKPICFLHFLNCLQSFLWPVWTPNCNYLCRLEANTRSKAESNGQHSDSPIWCAGWSLSTSPSRLPPGQQWGRSRGKEPHCDTDFARGEAAAPRCEAGGATLLRSAAPWEVLKVWITQINPLRCASSF